MGSKKIKNNSPKRRERERRRRRRRRGETETGRREGENRKLQGSKGFSGHWWVPAKALEEESGS